MNLNEKIKELRIKKDLTQQQLADILNVSAPAVNKWEKAVSYPDITLLPIIARALDTDLNTLLEFKENLTSREVALFLNELSVIKDFDIAYNKTMAKISEFPNCEELILNSMIILSGMSKMKGLDKDHLFFPYFERLSKSNNIQIKVQAIQMIINDKIKKKQYEKAYELIESLPEQTGVKKKKLLCEVELAKKEYQNAAKLCEEMILLDAQSVLDNLMILHEIYLEQKDYEMSKYISDVIYDVSKIFQNEYVGYMTKLMDAVNRKDKIDTLKYLAKLISSLSHLKFDTSLYRHMEIKESDGSIKSMIIDLIKSNKDFDFVRNDKKFKAIIKIEG